ncbi:hypothetical protein QVD17_24402 [Tagetes erecta]|uniref:Retrotransposon gag domain-containing protein n=1 Tax=Tagetes erecta TaxID=13708 RepID=A0AAD8KFM2_TARER|nr:hypothetical protein QVD17_24402 [Tagetes erecta]
MRRTRSSGPPEFVSLPSPEHRIDNPEEPEYVTETETDDSEHSGYTEYASDSYSALVSSESVSVPDTVMGDQPPVRRVIADYARPTAAGARSSVACPPIQANNWSIPPQIISMVTNTVQFHGLPSEDPNSHLSRFARICDTFQVNGVTENACKLRLFPFSLTDRAHSWLESLPQLVEKFYNGVTPTIRNIINTTAGGNLLTTKTVEECNDLFEDLAISSFEYPNTRAPVTSTPRGVHQVDSNTALLAQVEALTKMVKDLQQKKVQTCEICRGAHDTVDCPIAPTDDVEHVDYAWGKSIGSYGQGDYSSGQTRFQNTAFGNSYNPNWKNHPGFSWRNQNPPGFQQRPQGSYQGQGSSSGGGSY